MLVQSPGSYGSAYTWCLSSVLLLWTEKPSKVHSGVKKLISLYGIVEMDLGALQCHFKFRLHNHFSFSSSLENLHKNFR